jgi:alpha-1,6-mannosyltransferase
MAIAGVSHHASTMMAPRAVLAGWLLLAAIFSAAAVLLVWASPRFGYEFRVIQIPALELALAMSATGLAYLALRVLIPRSASFGNAASRRLIFFVIAIGLILRLGLVWTEPALEDDYQRYLWDGAVTAHGLNPYAVAPAAAKTLGPDTLYWQLVRRAGPIVDRINNGELKTIYPPVTQAAFALAYMLKPWSLVAWRVVCLAGEVVTLVLLLALLAHAGFSPLWSAIYWWNPLVIKELINSAHMEAILMPLVLLAVLLTVKGWYVRAAFALGVAAGAKLWPLVLAPLLFRPLLGDWRRLVFCGIVIAALIVVWALPVVLGGLDQNSGFVAYAQRWRTNSALLLLLERFATSTLGHAGWSQPVMDFTVRAVLGLAILGTVLWLAVAPLRDAADLLWRIATATGVLVLLSPVQFPWYMTWMLAFAAFAPFWGLLAVTATTPLYYLSFHHLARDTHAVFTDGIVWAIWLPVWFLLAAEAMWRRTAWRRWPPAAASNRGDR